MKRNPVRRADEHFSPPLVERDGGRGVFRSHPHLTSTIKGGGFSGGKGLFLGFLLLICRVVFACEDLTVRDAAFSEPRGIHNLFVIADGNDPQGMEIERRLANWLIESGSGLNIVLERIEANNPSTDWSRVGIPSAPPSTPVVVLSGNDASGRRNFYIQHWEPEPGPEDLQALQDSPVRVGLRSRLGTRMAAVLFVPGTEPSPTDSAAVVDAAIADWSGRERLAIDRITLDRSDPGERILVSFLGIPEKGPDWLALVFGKGKVTPPLKGSEINTFGLNEHLAALAAECTCLSTSANLGVDLPMKWSGAEDATFQPLRDSTASEGMEETVASVNWSSMKTTGIALAGLAALVVLGGAFLVLRRTGGDTPSLAR